MTEFYDQEKEPAEDEIHRLLREVDEFVATQVPILELRMTASTAHTLDIILRMAYVHLMYHIHTHEDNEVCEALNKAFEIDYAVMQHVEEECETGIPGLFEFIKATAKILDEVWDSNPDAMETLRDPEEGE